MCFLTRKDRRIRNLKAMVINREKLIEDQALLIESLRNIINSLEEDLKATKEASFEATKKERKTRTRAKKEASK